MDNDARSPASQFQTKTDTTGWQTTVGVERCRTHLYFRNDADAALLRVRDDVTQLIQRVRGGGGEGACRAELRVRLRHDGEALQVKQVPVQHVHLERCQAVDGVADE